MFVIQVDSKRERHVSDSLQNSFSSGSLDEEKLKKRAERFGVQFDPDTTNVTPVTKEQMKDLYQRYSRLYNVSQLIQYYYIFEF